MKLHILSDLHLEFAPFTPPQTDADVVILAGDIDQGTRGIAWARATFPDKEIIYLAGNHEYYKHEWFSLVDELRAQGRACGIHFLEDEAVTIQGVRFLGTTLWTDFDVMGAENRPLAMALCREHVSDFRVIRATETSSASSLTGSPSNQPPRLTPPQVRHRHLKSRAWLQQALDTPFDGVTVVVTHHLPSEKSVGERYQGDWANASFASRLDVMMGRAALWIHGHTHINLDYELHGTRVICNPRGYCRRDGSAGENPCFSPDLVVKI
jgi:predicted phosphodiesterase